MCARGGATIRPRAVGSWQLAHWYTRYTDSPRLSESFVGVGPCETSIGFCDMLTRAAEPQGTRRQTSSCEPRPGKNTTPSIARNQTDSCLGIEAAAAGVESAR